MSDTATATPAPAAEDPTTTGRLAAACVASLRELACAIERGELPAPERISATILRRTPETFIRAAAMLAGTSGEGACIGVGAECITVVRNFGPIEVAVHGFRLTEASPEVIA